MCHIIECDTIGRRPWLERFGLRLPAARQGYRREAHYGDHGVRVRPCCASQSATPINLTHEPTERTVGLLGLPMSVPFSVEITYIGVPCSECEKASVWENIFVLAFMSGVFLLVAVHHHV